MQNGYLPFLEGTQMMTPVGFRPLSHDEKLKAAQIAAGTDFSLDGYQVVRREFFSHKFDPTLTIKDKNIIFNSACISILEKVVYVQLLIHPDAKKLIIRPCSEGARDAIRWCTVKNDKRKSREISCEEFTKKLRHMMNWETMYRYKIQGFQVPGQVLFLFDLSSNEKFVPQTKGKRSSPKLPDEWENSFGMSVQDHDSSTQVDLNEGFTTSSSFIIDNNTGEVDTK